MRAAVIPSAGTVRIETVPVPEPGPGAVRIRLDGCGVCASNLGPWSGPPWFRFPTAPGGLGHEGWGTVDAVGGGVTDVAVGDRVAVLSDAAYAEHDVAPASSVVRLPPALDGRPFPAEPLGCAMNVLRRAGIGPGATVAIVGIGFLGALLTRLAVGEGARVIAISRRPFARAVAGRMGAAAVLPFDDRAAVADAVAETTGGALCDRVIEAVGSQAALDLAADLVRERGRLVIAGYHQDGPRQVNMQQWNWRGIDVVNAHERDPALYVQGMREAVDAVVSGRLEPEGLITHAYPLDRLADALDATRDRPDGFLKAVVTCR